MFDTTFTCGIDPATVRSDLKAGVFNDDWPSEKTRERKRATLNKTADIFLAYGLTSPEEMPSTRSDVAFFFDQHLKGGNFPRKSRLKTVQDAERWMKRYSVIVDVVNGSRAAKAAALQCDDDWALLLSYLAGQRELPQVFGSYEMIAIKSLVSQCRIRGISIADLTADKIRGFAPELSRKTIAALIKAIVRLNSLRDADAVPGHLLPDVSPEHLTGLAQPAKRVVPSLHVTFSSLMEAFVAEQESGRIVEMFGLEERTLETNELSESRIKNIRVALRWFWHGLVALDITSPNTPVDRSKLTRPALMFDLVGACASGLLGPICQSDTRRARINIVVSFLNWLEPGFAYKIPKRFFDLKTLNQAEKETADRIEKRRACVEFVENEEQQRQFFLMPRHFYNEARPLIENFDSLSRADGNGISMEQNRALELAMMAALTSINTVFPARLATLMKLEIYGSNQHIFFPEDEKRQETVVLEIPGNIVKNGRFASGITIAPSKMRNARKILKWYIDEVHPLILKYKHKRSDLRRPKQLFAGLNIDTVRRYWKCHIADIGLDLTPHRCRHFSASLLLASGVPLEDIAELLCDSVKVTERNYAFISRRMVIQNTMDAQAKIFRKLDI